MVHNLMIPEKVNTDFESTNDAGETIECDFQFMPWGSRWDAPSDEQPCYYTDWYLPLIEAGEGMPDALPEK